MNYQSVKSSYSSNPNSNQISTAQKRQILWNILEPGDPYDIKKSLIAKLPGDRKLFMGDNLEMVCLFQAAQIQRLIEHLDEYKLRYKQVQRRQLDRHSYEIQIKELAQRSEECQTIRIENGKLKDFIRKQTIELQQSKKKIDLDFSLQRKYESALKQIESMFQENNSFKTENFNLRNQNNNWKAKIQALQRTRMKQIQELRNTMQNQRKSQIQKQIRDISYKFNIQRSQLQGEIRRLREVLEARNREIEDYKIKINTMNTQITQLSKKSLNQVQLENTLNDYENKFKKLTQQIERLNRVLRDKTGELMQVLNRMKSFDAEFTRQNDQLRESNRKINILQQNNDKLNKSNMQLQNRLNELGDLNKKLIEYENRIALLSQQLERINLVLKNKVNELLQISNRYGKLQFQFENSKKIYLNEVNSIKSQYERKNSDNQTRIQLMAQENERLSELLRKFEYESNIKISNYQQKIQIYIKKQDENNRKINEISKNMTLIQTQYEKLLSKNEQFNKQNANLSQRLNQIDKLNKTISEMQNNIIKLAKENQMLNDDQRMSQENLRQSTNNIQRLINQINQLKTKLNTSSQDNENLKRKINQLNELNRYIVELEQKNKRLINQIERLNNVVGEMNNRIIGNQQRIVMITQENEQYKRRITELENSSRKMVEYENKIGLLSQEIERLNGILRSKLEELQNSEGRFQRMTIEFGELKNQNQILKRRIQQSSQKFEFQFNTKITTYEQRITIISQQNEQLKRRINELENVNRKMTEYENKIALLSQEIQRLNGILRGKLEELQQSQLRFQKINTELNEWRNENQGLKRKLQETSQRFEYEFNSKITSYQQRIVMITQENEQYKRRITELENSSRKMVEYENKIGLLSQEIERLNGILRSKLEELQNSEGRFQRMTIEFGELKNQNQILKRRIQQSSQKFEFQFNTKITTYEQRITIISQQNEQLKRRINELENVNRKMTEYENKIALLSQEIQRLNGILRGKLEELQQSQLRFQKINTELNEWRNENQGLKRKLQETSQRFEYEFNSKITSYQQRIVMITQENEQYKRRITELENSSRKMVEYENKIGLLSQEIERLNGILRSKLEELQNSEGRFQRMTIEFGELKNQNQILKRRIQQSSQKFEFQFNTKITTYEQRITIISQQNEQLKRRINELENVNRKMTEYENKIALLSQEIQRLNGILRGKLEELQQSQLRFQKINTELNEWRNENQGLKRKLQETSQRFEYEFNSKITSYQQRIVMITQENEQYKRRITELENSSRKMVEYENKIGLLSQEIERLNGILRSKLEELQNSEGRFQRMTIEFGELKNQNQILKRRIQQSSQKFEFQFNTKITTYEQRITIISQQNEQLKRRINELENVNRKMTEYENKIALLSQEIQRLNGILRGKLEELQQSQLRFQKINTELNEWRNENQGLKRKLQETSQRFEYEFNSKITSYQQRIVMITQENEQYKRRITELENSSRKMVEYENKIGLLSQEIERLNGILRSKLEELQNSEGRFQRMTIEFGELKNQNQILKRRIQQSSQKFEFQFNTKITTYEQRITIISQQNEQLKRRINELENVNRKMTEYENKIALLSQEIQRLNGILRGKLEELQQSQLRFQKINTELNEWRNENQGLKRKLQETSQRFEYEFNSKITSYQQRIVMITQENEQYKRRITELENSSRKMVEYENKIGLLSQEIERLNNVIKQVISKNQYLIQQNQNMSYRLSQIQKLTKSVSQLQSKIMTLIRQNQILSNDFQKTQQNLRFSTSQTSKLTNQLRQIQSLLNSFKLQNQSLRKINQSLVRDVQQSKILYQSKQSTLISQINVLTNAQQKSQYQSASKISIISNYEQRNSVLMRQNQQLKRKINDIQNNNQQKKNQLRILNQRNTKLMNQNKSLSEEIRNMQENLRQSNVSTNIMNRQLNDMRRNLDNVIMENESLKKRLGEMGEAYKVIVEYEGKITLLSQEIQRLNGILRGKLEELQQSQLRFQKINTELNEWRNENQGLKRKLQETSQRFEYEFNSKITSYQQRIVMITQENEQYKRRITELENSSRKMVEYENKIGLLSQEIERLNGILRSKLEELQNSEGRFQRMTIEFGELKNQNQILKRRIQQSSQKFEFQFNTKITTYEQRITIISQQNEQLKRRINELENVNRKMTQYENKIALLSQEIQRLNGILRGKLEELQQSQLRFQKINTELNEWRNENQGLKRKLQETSQRFEYEFNSKITSYQQRIVMITQENEQYKRRITELENSSRKMVEYENKIGLLSQEIERLNGILRSKLEELQNSEGRFQRMTIEFGELKNQNQILKRRIQQSSQKFEFQFNTKITTYEQRITIISQQNEQLKRRINELENVNRKMTQYENKIALLSQEIQRLNGILRGKLEELQQSQLRFQKINTELNEWRNENQGLKRKLQETSQRFEYEFNSKITSYQQRIVMITQENEQYKRRITELENSSRKMVEYENKIGLLSQEIERLNGILRSKLEELQNSEGRFQRMTIEFGELKNQNQILKRRIQQSSQKFEFQFNTKITTYEQRITIISQQNEQLKRRINELENVNRKMTQYENKIALLSQEIQRLNGILRGKLEELQQSQLRFQKINTELNEWRNENQGLKRKLQETSQRFEYEFNSKITSYQQRIVMITQENEQYKRRITELENSSRKMVEYENKIGLLSQEIERLNGILRSKLEELQNSEGRFQRMTIEFGELKNQNQILKRRIQQSSQKFEFQFNTKITTYEQRITIISQQNEQLKRRINELENVNRKMTQYENKIALLSQEIQRLNGILRGKLEELQQSQLRFQKINTELNEWRNENQGLKRKLQETSQRFEYEFNSKITSYQQRIVMITQENDKYKKLFLQFQNKNSLYSNQIQRLNNVLRSKVQEFQHLQSSYRQLTIVYNDFKQKSLQINQQNQNSKRKLHQNLVSLDQRFNLLNQENNQLKLKLSEFEKNNKIIFQYQNRIGLLSQQIERLNDRLRQKVQNLQILEQKLSKSNYQKQDLSKMVHQLERRLTQYQNRMQMLIQEIDRLNNVIKIQVQSKSTQYIQEIQRLNNALRIKVQQSQQWQQKYNILVNRFKDTELRVTSFSQQYDKLQQAYAQISRDYDLSKKKVSEHQQKFIKLSGQFQRLNQIIQQQKKQNIALKQENYRLKLELNKFHSLQQKNRKLAAQIDRLNKIIQQLKQELSQLRIRFSDETSLQKRINEHLALFVILFAQIQSLRKRVKQKEKEVEDVRRSSLAPFKI